MVNNRKDHCAYVVVQEPRVPVDVDVGPLVGPQDHQVHTFQVHLVVFAYHQDPSYHQGPYEDLDDEVNRPYEAQDDEDEVMVHHHQLQRPCDQGEHEVNHSSFHVVALDGDLVRPHLNVDLVHLQLTHEV
jgi:hypothetical protein